MKDGEILSAPRSNSLPVPISTSLENEFPNVFLMETWKKVKRLVKDGEVLRALRSNTNTVWVSNHLVFL